MLALLLGASVAACGISRTGRFDPEEQCWIEDQPELDLDSCTRRGPGNELGTELYVQSTDGTCWRLPYCSDYRTWEDNGWSAWDQATCSWDMLEYGPC